MEKPTLSIPIEKDFNRRVYSFALAGMRRTLAALEDNIATAERVLRDMEEPEQTPTPHPTAIAAPPPAATGKASTPKRKLSAAGRKAIADAQKKRWAKKRAGK